MQIIECIASPVLQNSVGKILKVQGSSQNSKFLSQEQKSKGILMQATESSYYLELKLFLGRHFSLYLARPELPEDCRRFAQIIHKHGSYLHVMIEDLLSLARIENEKESFILSPVLALDALDTATSFCHKALQTNKLRLIVDVSDKIVVQANRIHLERVFRNLLENACRYAVSESDIVVSAKVNQNECVFMVENKGVYIAPEDIERIFERFYRVEKDRSSSVNVSNPNMLGSNGSGSGASTGLGLAIYKHIIDRHGGIIKAESTDHKTYGVSSFIFTFSLVDSLSSSGKNDEV